jgi:endonuclease/exonuclease/phosphatase family metal-dependent hydrolase
MFADFALCASVDVKVMSFNVWGAEDTAAGRERIVNTLRQAGADIIGFQEMGGGALATIASSMGYFSYDQQLGSEAILSRYRIVGSARDRYGALVELAPGHEAWIFNTHLNHAPYGPYQLNGIAYFGGRIYDPALPASIASVVNDQVAARDSELQAVLRSVTDSGAIASGLPVFVTGDFNEASHLDWTVAAAAAGVHATQVPWPASSAMAARGFTDSWRDVYPNEVTHPGRTWSPVYPSTYMNRGDNPAVQPQPVLEPQDRIDFVYYAGAGVTAVDSKRSGPVGGDIVEELEIANYPSDHNAVTSTFRLPEFDHTRLTFRALGAGLAPVPAGYGSRVLSTPNVAVELAAGGGRPNDPPVWIFFDNAVWSGGVAQLDAGGGEQADGSATFRVVLTPDAGFGVSVDSFSLVDYGDGNGLGHSVRWELIAGGVTLASGMSDVAPNGQAQIVTGQGSFADAELELRLTQLSGRNNRLAVDDVLFRQAVIPEPGTLGLALLACPALWMLRRPKRGRSVAPQENSLGREAGVSIHVTTMKGPEG